MKRREFTALIGGLAIAWPLASHAQQALAPPKRVGVLNQFRCPIPPASAFTRRLVELGWVEGRDFVFDCVSTVGQLEKF